MYAIIRSIKCLFSILLILAGLPFLWLTSEIANAPISTQFYKLDSTQTQLIQTATLFVDGFVKNNSRLPTPSEFESWKVSKTKEHPGYDGWGYSYRTAPFSEYLIKAFGSPPENAFCLTFWEGDVFIDYASWSRDGELAYIPDSEYYVYGSKVTDLVVFSTICLALFGFGIFLLKKCVYHKCA